MIIETDRLKMVMKLEGIEHKNRKINKLVQGGFMSHRLGRYAGLLAMIDFETEEAEMYARYKDIKNVGKNLAEVKKMIDVIANLYLQPLFERNPEAFFRGDLGEYKELINLAKNRYEQSIRKCEQILEAAA